MNTFPQFIGNKFSVCCHDEYVCYTFRLTLLSLHPEAVCVSQSRVLDGIPVKNKLINKLLFLHVSLAFTEASQKVVN